MKQLFCGSRIPRSVKCEQCGLHLTYNKSKGQTEVVCPKCGNKISIVRRKYQ